MKYAAMASTVLATIFAPFFAPSFASTTTAGTIRLDEAAEARAGLRTEAIDEKSFGDEVRLVGQTVRAPGTTMTVKAMLEGRVDQVYVAPGDRVERGSALVALRSHDLLDLRGRYLQAAEARKLADTRVRAGEQLLELAGISRIELEDRVVQALLR